MGVGKESDFKAKVLIDAIAAELAQNGSELVKKINAVYCIKVLQGDKVGTWVIDVKNGTGSVRYDDHTPGGGADVTFTMDDDNWLKLMSGKLSPQQAYFSGQMKLSGNLGLAMQLENILKPLRQLHSKL